MSDLISRKAAIDALEREKSLVERPITETRWFDLGLGKAQDVLSELPPAQPEQKTGKWIVDGEYIDCSVCRREKWSRVPYENLVKGFKYCPKCGAKMEDGADGI